VGSFKIKSKQDLISFFLAILDSGFSGHLQFWVFLVWVFLVWVFFDSGLGIFDSGQSRLGFFVVYRDTNFGVMIFYLSFFYLVCG
jgi:hypothetical protein